MQSVSCFYLICQFVAYSSDTLNFNGAIFFEMVAKTRDVNIETAKIEVVVIAPKFFKQGRCIYSLAKVAAETEQYFRLSSREDSFAIINS